MEIVNDASGFLAIAGDSDHWAFEDGEGKFYLDFTETNGNAAGEGFNPQAFTSVGDVFSVTNQSTRDVYVWFESPDWPWKMQGNGSSLRYRIDADATSTKVLGQYEPADVAQVHNHPEYGRRLLWTEGTNYEDGQNGKLAYVLLEPGDSFSVEILVGATGYYANQGLDFSHTVKVKADEDAPTRP
jgi:hypothetical protein